MPPKTKAPETVVVDGEEMETASVEYKGVTYVVRELSIDEGDEFDTLTENQKPDAATKMWMRSALERAIVSPPTTMDQIGKWPGRKYVTILRVWNRLNVLPEANPTEPAGSAGPTSPDGGEPSPTP